MSENNEVSYIEETTNKTGTISYANDVIAIIAGLAATEIAGISGMSGGITSGIAEMLGRKNLTKGVKVEVGTEETAIDLNVIVDYGVQIHKVAFDVQEKVKKAVETMTGLHVVEVNVYVQGVNVAQEPKDVPRLK